MPNEKTSKTWRIRAQHVASRYSAPASPRQAPRFPAVVADDRFITAYSSLPHPHSSHAMRRIGFLTASSVAAIAFLPITTPPSTDNLPGFTAQSARAELDWESKFDSIPSPDTIRQNMKRLSARPHHVGSPYDHDNAVWLLARFKSFGWDAHIEQFDVLFPTPRDRLVEMVAPTRFVAKLQEPTVPGDPTSSQHAEQLPSYNAYSADGDVTGPLVYVNYGVPADYEELERHGISVKGAIVIARYGGSWRGIKPKVAAEHGAVGCLIYSDPRD